jgi:hypothetical protein
MSNPTKDLTHKIFPPTSPSHHPTA